MSQFETFVQGLDKYPKIDTFCVKDKDDEPLLVNDKAIMVETIRVYSGSKEGVELQLMGKIHDFIEGKQVWVRTMPVVLEDFDNNVWTGRARIAVL